MADYENAASTQSEIAQRIATKAHEGQVDKAGAPYINHPAHVAASVEGDNAKAVAWLHDVVEDTPITFADLADQGMSPTVIDALRLLTHDEATPYFDYIRAIKNNSIARAVKLADLRHNSDLSRIPNPSEKDFARMKKYREAIAILEG